MANPQDKNPLTPGVEYVAPPQMQQPGINLPAILSAIGGLGLNVAGIATRSGAHGSGSLNLAQQLQEQSEQGAKQQYQQQKEQYKQQGDAKVGQALAKQAGEIDDLNVREQFMAHVNNGQVDEAQRTLNHFVSEKRANERFKQSQEAAARAEKKYQTAQDIGALNDAIKEQEPHFDGSVEMGKILANHLVPLLSREDLKNHKVFRAKLEQIQPVLKQSGLKAAFDDKEAIGLRKQIEAAAEDQTSWFGPDTFDHEKIKQNFLGQLPKGAVERHEIAKKEIDRLKSLKNSLREPSAGVKAEIGGTKLINGVPYEKAPGGWRKVKKAK